MTEEEAPRSRRRLTDPLEAAERRAAERVVHEVTASAQRLKDTLRRDPTSTEIAADSGWPEDVVRMVLD